MSAETLQPQSPQKQIQLPFSKAWQISLRSIKIRLARSFITAGGILLGIAFYSSVRTAGLFPPEGNPNDPAVISANVRQEWLALMALLVCFFGITNSMLMSVTERFREIGTMKCLGALDSFVVKLFFIEAGLMGVLASAIGWLLGWLIISLIHIFGSGFGSLNGAYFGGSLIQLVESVAIGTIITLIATVPPAINAAKMPPAMALRSDI